MFAVEAPQVGSRNRPYVSSQPWMLLESNSNRPSLSWQPWMRLKSDLLVGSEHHKVGSSGCSSVRCCRNERCKKAGPLFTPQARTRNAARIPYCRLIENRTTVVRQTSRDDFQSFSNCFVRVPGKVRHCLQSLKNARSTGGCPRCFSIVLSLARASPDRGNKILAPLQGSCSLAANSISTAPPPGKSNLAVLK